MRQKNIHRVYLFLTLIFVLFFLFLIRPALHHPEEKPSVRLGCMVGMGDFVAYWSAEQVWLNGGNPYNAGQVAEVQSKLDCQFNLVQSYWNPPWLLLIFRPFLFSDPFLASLCWITFSLVCVILAALIVSSLDGSTASRRYLTICSMLLFLPLSEVLYWGQLGAFLTLVLVFGWFLIERGKLFLAGMVLSLLSLKYHVFYLMFIWVFFFIRRTRAWALLFGLVFACALLYGTVHYFDPSLIRRWALNSENAYRHIMQYRSLNLVGIFRELFSNSDRAAQNWTLWSIPVVMAVISVIFCRRLKSSQEFLSIVPTLLCLSILTGPYIWFHDMMVLSLVPATLIASSTVSEKWVGRIIAFEICCYALAGIPGFLPNGFVWFPLAMLGLLYALTGTRNGQLAKVGS